MDTKTDTNAPGADLHSAVMAALATVDDPEMGENLVDLGVVGEVYWATAAMTRGIAGFARIPNDHHWQELRRKPNDGGWAQAIRSLSVHQGIDQREGSWLAFYTWHRGDVWDTEWDPGGYTRRHIRQGDPTIKWSPELVARKAEKLARQIYDAEVQYLRLLEIRRAGLGRFVHLDIEMEGSE